MSILSIRWQQTCQQLSITADPVLFDFIVSQYSEPHRHYHTLQHLSECFYYFDLVKAQANNAAAIEMAIWFHDIIYNVKANNNEVRSAQLAMDYLAPYNLPHTILTSIYQLIQVTDHKQQVKNLDEQIIVDVDLAILGASSVRFAEYQQQIRSEYSWVPYFLYKTKRKQILTTFLNQQPLYHTPKLATLLAKQASLNLSLATQ